MFHMLRIFFVITESYVPRNFSPLSKKPLIKCVANGLKVRFAQRSFRAKLAPIDVFVQIVQTCFNNGQRLTVRVVKIYYILYNYI